jgi:hypothetical protein
MSLDDVLFGLIVGGVGLCAAYFRDEYIGWREHRTAEMRRETSQRELHMDGVSHREDADSIRENGSGQGAAPQSLTLYSGP